MVSGRLIRGASAPGVRMEPAPSEVPPLTPVLRFVVTPYPPGLGICINRRMIQPTGPSGLVGRRLGEDGSRTMNTILPAIGMALREAFAMFWEVLWPLILGFGLSGVVQALVSHRTLARLLGDDSPRSLALATLFGVASSSCSYAAVALARSLFRKGASFTAAMVFELSSTNLVIELGIILIVLLGWPFAAAEYAGGVVMVVLLALLFRLTLTPRLVAMARQQAERGVAGRMEGHATMDMSVSGGSLWSRLASGRGVTATSHFFVMDWASIWQDLLLGFLIAGALEAWVPTSFWRDFFLTGDPTWAKIEGPLVGPLVAIVSFVCSVGNVPLAAVLWRGG